jgi:hypothetical protein
MNARVFLALAALLPLLVLLGCQSDSGGIAVEISPGNPAVIVGQSVQFSADVSGTDNHAVRWRVVGTGNSVGATISDAGLFIATTSGRYTVSAISVVDATKSASAAVVVQPQVGIVMAPTTATLAIGETRTFLVGVYGSDNTRYTVSADGGTATAEGESVTYTAPNTTGTYHVTVTSMASTAQKAVAVITVKPKVQFGAGLKTTLSLGETLAVTAQTVGTANTAVTWSLQETDAPAGTLTAPTANTVNFKAPQQAGTYHLIATSVADTSVSTTLTLTVQSGSATINIQ